MIRFLLSFFFSLFLLAVFSCSAVGSKGLGDQISEQPRVSYNTLGFVKDNSIIIKQDVDLKGCECVLPKGYTLEFKGGIIRNGSIIGNETGIVSKGVAFDHVNISGRWNVPYINTYLFSDLTYENALKSIFALANPRVNNTIHIAKGKYIVRALSEWDHCLKVCSNTNVYLNGTISLVSNSYRGCDILFVNGHNINITGKGVIEGDAITHIGDKGEWGMGIKVLESENILIQGLSIKDCWGDCIYVGEKSKNVDIKKCTLSHGRRQGISITSADGVTITKCIISDVGGASPECAIDLEPNDGESVDDIVINKVIVRNCVGGIMLYGKATNSRIGQVFINKCDIQSNGKNALGIRGCEDVMVKGNQLYQLNGGRVLSCNEIQKAAIKGNRMIIKKEFKKNDEKRLIISNCEVVAYSNNKELDL